MSLHCNFQEQWFNKVPTTQWCVHDLSMRTNNNEECIYFKLSLSISYSYTSQGEESRFYHMLIQFNAGLGARTKQAKTIAIQRRIDHLDKRYYDGLINVMEYLDGLSFTVATQKNDIL